MFREEMIVSLVKGKKVLDCGGMDHGAFKDKNEKGEWLHDLLSKNASECLGVDILSENVERMNRGGKYRFQVANVEELPFSAEYDVVVAGEIVEHIYNMGKFLDSAWRSLRQSGTLIITTPNVTALTSLGYALFARRELCHPEHTCYYSPQTLRYIVTRHGFRVDELRVLPRKSKIPLLGQFRQVLSRVHPLLADQIVLVATKTDSQQKYSDKW